MTSTSEDAPTHLNVNRRARKPVETSSDSEEDEVSDRRNSMDSKGNAPYFWTEGTIFTSCFQTPGEEEQESGKCTRSLTALVFLYPRTIL